MSGSREAVLLGAGSSVEAGVPATFDLTSAILKALETELVGNKEELVGALRFVVGAMIYEASTHGNDPYAGMDVERVFRAVRLLGDRDQSELAPFIGSWNRQLEVFETPSRAPFEGRDLGEAAAAAVADPFLEGAALGRMIRRVAGTARMRPYEQLAAEMLGVLRRIVWIDDSARVGYLTPIAELGRANPGPLVATLNYDNTIELAAKSAGIAVDTGVDSWVESGSIELDPDKLNLLKLHGSANWRLKTIDTVGNHLPRTTIEVVDDPRQVEISWYQQYRPALVFGDDNKLQADGPFLDLLFAFRRGLSECHRLTVIGYSFRDSHINHEIRLWMNNDPNNSISIVDPAPPRDRSNVSLIRDLETLRWDQMDRVEYVELPAGEAIPQQFSYFV